MPRSPKTAATAPRHRAYVTGTLPSREDILAAMAEDPGLDGKRDLAKRFGIKGDMRTPFKVLLKEMEAEGFLARTRKTIRRTATLPAVTVLDIPVDADPENLHAFPSNWNEEEGERPRVIVATPE
ncbi:MAG TPA: ribonuclease R, partial [Devosiaceae bacterium]|nr:ribonuclease R [Devosiaceae bacterium]